MAVKIAHCGDLHIGAELSTLGEKAPRRRAELIKTLENICAYCNSTDTDILLVAGDLFDSCRVSEETVNAVKSCFAALKNTTVFIVAGNHDCLTPKGPLDRDFGENVHIFRDSEYVETENARVFGFSFFSSFCDEHTLPTAKKDGKTEILIMHADLDGGPYNPVTEQKIAATGMNYVALGHVHSTSGIHTAGGVSFAYSGCPEPLGFDETGEKGIIAGTVSPTGVDLEFVKMCTREYKELTLKTDNFANMEELKATARELIRGNENNAIKLILNGECAFSPDTEYLKSAIEDKVYAIRIKNLTRPAENLELLRKEQTLKGIFTDRLLRLAEQNEYRREDVLSALRLGLAAFDGREVGFSDN